eukprot:COSAG03_NODE_4313_length_1596_cov_14.612558_3_plen_125_part_01
MLLAPAFAAAAEDTRGALSQELQRLSRGGSGAHPARVAAADLDQAAVREAMRAVYEEQEELLARAAAAGRTPSARAPQSAAGSSQEMHHNPHQGQPPDSVQLLMSTTAAFERRLEAIVSDFERRI